MNGSPSFTDRMAKAMQAAQKHARSFNHEFVGTEHVLLAIIDDFNSVGCFVLRSLVSLAKVQELLRSFIVSGPEMVTIGKLPMTPRLKLAIEVAQSKAKFWNHQFVNTEHMLIGIAGQDGSAAECLSQLGASRQLIEEKVVDLLSLSPQSDCVLEAKRLIAVLVHCGDWMDSVSNGNDELILASRSVRESIRWLVEYRARFFNEEGQ